MATQSTKTGRARRSGWGHPAVLSSRVMHVAAALGAAWPMGAAGQDRHSDFQLWSSVSATMPLSKHVEARIDGLVIVADDVSRVGRELGRAVVLVKLDERLKLGGGYVWTQVAPQDGINFNEHRLVQELDFRTGVSNGAFVLALRTQMEERWREGRTGTSLRLRQLTRLEVPVKLEGVRVVLWNEYFYELQRTPWSGRTGPSLMLNFVGVHLPVGPRVAIEPGYLNQTQFDRGPNRVRHAVAMFATVRF